MEEWTRLRNHNHYPSYHPYALGFLRQHGAEPTNGNLNNWSDAGVMDLSNYNAGMPQAYYPVNDAKNLDDSPPESPGQHVLNANDHNRGHPGFVYLGGDPQSSRLILAAPGQTVYDDQSESPSYSDAHTSPDSWRSDSSRDESFPQVDPTTWMRKEPDYEVCGPIGSQDVSPLTEPTCLIEDPQPLGVTGKQSSDVYGHAPAPTPVKQSTAARNTTKGKVRTAFSESQMGILIQRFSVQKYLTPAEMKNLADMIGLTYKQVKTWFQNRRMKLRRHQKDNNWMCGRYNTNKEAMVHGNMYSNSPPQVPLHQDVRPQQEHHNQHMMDAAYRKPAPQNLAFYVAAMGNVAGPAGYPAWSPQPAVPHRPPQVSGWCVPQRVGHYEYNVNAFNPAAASNDSSFESQDGESANSSGSLSTGAVRNPSQ